MVQGTILMSLKINYNSILENYNKEIQSKLRGFNTDYDYLKYWVPSPDTVESIYNLIVNFRECGINDVSLEFNENFLNNENIKSILNLKNEVGELEYKISDKKIVFNIKIDGEKFDLIKSEISDKNQKKKEESYVNKLDLKFKKNLFSDEFVKILNTQNINYEKNLFENTDNIIKIKKNFYENQITFFINKNQFELKGINVVETNSINVESNLIYKFINLYKPFAINLPFREVLDHSVIYFFHNYFPLNKKNHGIFHYENYGVAFQKFREILKEVYNDINLENDSLNLKVNNFYQKISESWKQKKIEDKEKITNEIILKFCENEEIEKKSICLKKIENDFKIILDVNDEIRKSNIFQKNYILMLENFFKKNCDFRIELFLGEKRDNNKLRL